MEKRVLLTELVDRGTHLRKEITPTATITDNGKYPAGTFWDANKTLNEIVAGATDAQDTLKEVEDKLNKEISDARKAEQDIKDQIDDILGIDAQDIADLKQIVEDLDPETGILSVIDGKADKSEMSISTSGDQTTITLKSGTQATVLNAHQDISGKANTSDLTAHTTNTSVHVTQSLLDRIHQLEVEVIGNGHDWVEIGGVKWATMNLGASSVDDYGKYYSWGDTQGYAFNEIGTGANQHFFTPSQYKYGDGTDADYVAAMTKYNMVDNLTVLEDSDDAVKAAWGGSWRMPTSAEFQSLLDATTVSVIDDHNGSGIKGTLYTDKTDSSKKVFFPWSDAAKDFQNSPQPVQGREGAYLSKTVKTPKNQYETASAMCLRTYGSASGSNTVYGLDRTNGYPIRPVLAV